VASPSPSSSLPAAVRHPEVSVHSVSQHQQLQGSLKAKPYLTLVVGQDSISTGLTARLWLPSRGRWATSELLIGSRWLMPPMNVEDLARLGIRGLHTYLVRSGAEPANTDGTSV
jgi:hypothetical protein